LQEIPNEILEMDLHVMPLIEAAYNCDLGKEGEIFAVTIIENIENKISSGELNENEKNKINYTLYEVGSKIGNNPVLKERIEEIVIRIN